MINKCDTVIRVDALCLLATVLGKDKLHDQALAAWDQALKSVRCCTRSSAMLQQHGLQWLCIIHMNVAILHDRYLGNLKLAQDSFRQCLQVLTEVDLECCSQKFRQTQAYVCTVLVLRCNVGDWTCTPNFCFMMQVMLFLAMSFTKSVTKNMSSGPVMPVEVSGMPGCIKSVPSNSDPNSTSGTVLARRERHPMIGARNMEIISLSWRGVGLLQDCRVHRLYVCAAYMCVSSACQAQASQPALSTSVQYALVSKACNAAEQACSIMGLSESGCHRVPMWDKASSPIDHSECCIYEASLLNRAACLSAYVQMCASNRNLPALGSNTDALLLQASCQHVNVACAAAKSLFCSCHPLHADTRRDLEELWLEKLSCLAACTEVEEMITQRLASAPSDKSPSPFVGNGPRAVLEEAMQAIRKTR